MAHCWMLFPRRLDGVEACKLQLINFRHRESYERSFYTKHGWEERPLAANFALYLD